MLFGSLTRYTEQCSVLYDVEDNTKLSKEEAL